MVQFLPIVERELRVAARQSKTWWRRVLTTAAALVLFTFFYLVLRQWQVPSMVGSAIFKSLTVFGALCSLLAGPLATVDCLVRERREGTLGLLFLTDLRSRDIVLGKMAAASLDLVFGLVAIIPVVALSLMLGGNDLLAVALVALALFNILFLSLATGLLASSTCASGRGALGFTVLLLLFLTLVVPMLGENVFGISTNSNHAGWFYMCCPSYAMHCCLDGRSGVRLLKSWDYWLNMGGMAGLAWGLLAIACVRTRNGWQELPASPRETRWRQRLVRLSQGKASARLAWRRSMLERNPVGWLDGRDRLVDAALWSTILGSGIVLAAAHLGYPRLWPDQDLMILWPIWTHYILCVLIALQAPRRLADDKQSGALELLLCTPIQPSEIIRGGMLVLRRRYGRALLALMGLDVFLAWAYFSEHGGWSGFLNYDRATLPWVLCGLAVFPWQAWSMARVGLYQGLRQGHSLRATFRLVWKLGVLPWVLFALTMFAYELAARLLNYSRLQEHAVIFGSWVALHWLVFGSSMARANWQLHRNFRKLAAPSIPRPWWKSCLGRT